EKEEVVVDGLREEVAGQLLLEVEVVGKKRNLKIGGKDIALWKTYSTKLSMSCAWKNLPMEICVPKASGKAEEQAFTD
ncbi:unnamed protein product, partial [Larinioides sclopetarius]